MYFRSTAFWLFWLTFVSIHHNQLNSDCCFGAALKPERQRQQQSAAALQHSEQQPLQPRLAVVAAARGSAAINLKLSPMWQQQLNQQPTAAAGNEKMFADAGGTSPATTSAEQITETATAARAAATHAASDKHKYLKNAKNVAMPVHDFLADFKENVAKHFANNAPFGKHRDGAATATSTAASTPAVAGDIPPPQSAPHAPERRHIVPEKLQYTKEIHVKQGRLMGITRNFQVATQLRDVDQYLGLPYAEAPVGSRRFMPPGAPLPWPDLKIARHLPPVCPQKLPDISIQSGAKMSRGRQKHLMRLLPYLKVESEDCLYLNVYVPREDGLKQSQSYPVIVYIHGESFEWNSGNPYDGSVLASYGQVIVVTINYRLGVLGFLKPALNDNTVSNFGLLDQIAALHWVKENIASFGGDKHSVTLMGHSTGAACVNYLMVSPVASGLFHRAVLMSGSAMSDWASSNHTLQLTMQLAHQLDCPLSDEHEEMLSCLRGKRYQDILKIPTSFPQFSTSLGPIVDGHVIPNQPYKDMGHYTEHFSRYDLLFGVTESESYHTLGATALEDGLRENERDNLLRFYMQSRFDVRPDLALAATLKKYNDMYNNPNKASNLEHRDVVLDILSDARVVGPLMQTGLFHADVNRRNYMYVFGHNSATGPHASLPHSIAGEELAFVFGAPLAPAGPFHSNYSAHEKLLAEAVMGYWTNFAKTGNPKAPWKGSFLNLHALEWDRYDLDWPEFNKRTQAYCNIGIPPSIGYKYRQIYMNFWNKELPDELNQIAALQQQPFLPAHYAGTVPHGGTSSIYPSRQGGEIIAGHMSKFDTRGNTVEDPLRTLKQLLKETMPMEASSAAENMYNAPPTFGVARMSEDELVGWDTQSTHAAAPAVSHAAGVHVASTSTATTTTVATTVASGANSDAPEKEEELAKSETTLQLLIGLIVVFIVLNVIIYSTFLLQKKKKNALNKRKLAGILSYDGATEDELKRSKQTTQNDGDDSYILDVVRKSNTYEAVKMERSPINGYKMTRQLSSSTVDTHTKVCEWISAATGERKGLGGLLIGGTLPRVPHTPNTALKKKSSSPTFSSLRGSSGGGGSSFTQQQPHKVNVAVDATPQARSNSVLQQEPIELSKLKSADGRNIIICQEVEVTDQELLAPQNCLDAGRYSLLMRQHSADTQACEAELAQHSVAARLPIEHKHSHSDPVEMYHSNNGGTQDEQVTSFMAGGTAALPDINVTSRDETDALPAQALTPAQQLTLIKRRNYPKVLPTQAALAAGGLGARDTDSPPMTLDLSTTNKRYSLPPNSYMPHLLTGKQLPPVPPPRTISTLGRRPSAGRRSSQILTTSPVMLAQDYTVEEEEPEITQNTLIVGPIVPKATGDGGNYSTLKRLAAPIGGGKSGGDVIAPTILRTSSACNVATPAPAAHHTEQVYAIEAVSAPCTPLDEGCHYFYPYADASLSVPSTPARLPAAAPPYNPDVIYAQPVKSAIKANLAGAKLSAIPRMLPTTTTAATATPTATNIDSNSIDAVAVTTQHNCNSTVPTTGDHQVPTTTTPTTTTSALSRIPRKLSFSTQQKQQQQGNMSIATTAATTADSTTMSNAFATSFVTAATATTTTTTAVSSSNSRISTASNSSAASTNSAASSTDTALSSTASTSSAATASSNDSLSTSSNSSNSSSTTVRTELQQQQQQQLPPPPPSQLQLK